MSRSLAVLLLLLGQTACSFLHPKDIPCESSEQCPAGHQCQNAVCISLDGGYKVDFGDLGFAVDAVDASTDDRWSRDILWLTDLHRSDLHRSDLHRSDLHRSDAPVAADGYTRADTTHPDTGRPDQQRYDSQGGADHTNCPSNPCDPVVQCGCGNNQTCDVEGVLPQCREANQQQQQGQSCTQSLDCQAGLTCLKGADHPMGTCHTFCAADFQCQGGGGRCFFNLPGTEYLTCTTDCDPVVGSGCPSGFSCHLYYNPDQVRLATDCSLSYPVGTGFQACDHNRDCSRGRTCIKDNPFPGDNYCRPYCRSNADCSVSEDCHYFSYDIDGIRYGVCYFQ